MAYGPNRAPRIITVVISLILVALGALGTFGGLYPTFGIWLYVAATVLMMLGVLFKGL